jgi:hypothetical protein
LGKSENFQRKYSRIIERRMKENFKHELEETEAWRTRGQKKMHKNEEENNIKHNKEEGGNYAETDKKDN